ncbi:MAG: hypothetical protein QM737_02830 [Ferruginibacter sp.]
MNLNYAIDTDLYRIEVYSDEKKHQPGTIVVIEKDKDDAILIESFKDIRTFQKAVEQVGEIIPPDKNKIVVVTKGTEQWLAIFDVTFQYFDSLRTGYIKNSADCPLSLKNQNSFPFNADDWEDL